MLVRPLFVLQLIMGDRFDVSIFHVQSFLFKNRFSLCGNDLTTFVEPVNLSPWLPNIVPDENYVSSLGLD